MKFLPINGDYRVTANAVLKYFSVMALKDGKPAKLQDDGTGAIWAIGKGIGKPSVTSSEVVKRSVWRKLLLKSIS